METYQVGIIATVVFSVWLFYAVYSWRRNRSRQEKFLPKPEIFSSPNADSWIPAFYVATVFESEPLKRVLAHGLTYRGFAKVIFDSKGIGISRVGEIPLLIPMENIISVDSSSSALDKAVERDGITLINWKLGETNLQTQLRFQNLENRQTALDYLSKMGIGK